MKSQVIGYASVMLTAFACGNTDDTLSKTHDRQGSPEVDAGAGEEGACYAEQCFDITAEKDISFIAVEAQPCEGADVTLDLFQADGTPVNIQPQPQGQGKSCSDIHPDALKFEGLSEDHYVLCVGYQGVASTGNIIVTTKAGQICDQMNWDGTCDECPDDGAGGAGMGGFEPGTGGSDAGTGGSDTGTGGSDAGTGGSHKGGAGGDCP